MKHWIHHCTKEESRNFAIQIVGECYIPWSPAGGRHIVDDFGELQEALPDRFFLEDFSTLAQLHWSYYPQDQQYRGH